MREGADYAGAGDGPLPPELDWIWKQGPAEPVRRCRAGQARRLGKPESNGLTGVQLH